MGQSVSASRDGDGEGTSCVGGGCIAAPGCFPFTSRGRRRLDAFEENVGVAMTMTVLAEEAEPPPEVVPLSDAEDGDDGGAEKGGNEGDTWLEGTNTTVEEEKGTLREAESSATATAIPEEVLSRIVAVDCGMARVPGGTHQALRRVCVVDGRGRPLLSALVRVADGKARYLSSLLSSSLVSSSPRINGRGDNLDLGVPADEVMEKARGLLRGKIVVGHSVEGDLAILGLGRRAKGMRDFEVRDTAAYEPFLQGSRRAGQSTKAKKLKDLVRERLGREVQVPGRFHCCEEDAIAALDLYLSVYHEWEGLKQLEGTKENTKGATTVATVVGQVQHNREKGLGHCQQALAPVRPKGKQRNKKPMQGKKKKVKNNKKTKKMDKRKKEQTPARRPDRTTQQHSSCNDHPVAYSLNLLVSSSGSLILFWLLLPMRLVHSAACLSGDAINSATHQRSKDDVAPANRSNRQRGKLAKKKTRKSILIWIRNSPKKKQVDNIFLSCHLALEVRCIILTLVRLWHGDVSSIHRANGALAVGAVGIFLLRGKHLGKNRDDYISRVLNGILGQYHGIHSLASIAGLGNGADSAPMMDAVPPRVNLFSSSFDNRLRNALTLAKRVASTLIRQRERAKSAAIEPAFGNGLVPMCIWHLVEMGSTKFEFVGGTIASSLQDEGWVPLSSDVALSCWFVLRAAGIL